MSVDAPTCECMGDPHEKEKKDNHGHDDDIVTDGGADFKPTPIILHQKKEMLKLDTQQKSVMILVFLWYDKFLQKKFMLQNYINAFMQKAFNSLGPELDFIL